MTSEPHDGRDNLTRLLNLGRRKRARVNRRYSFFVRGMRLLLPMAALAIVAVVMAWPRMDEQMAPIPKEEIIPQTTGRNELINPRFESANAEGQPYIITATRAEQTLDDQKIVVMQEPVANITLDEGSILDAESKQGTYDQQGETLVLDGNVKLRHNNGYTLESTYLHIRLQDRVATTPQPVSVFGPDATLEAKGMSANPNDGKLIFTGPAKLTLNQTIKGL